MKKYVDVVIFKNVLSLDRLYTYEADFDIEVGDFILVDFNGDLLIALALSVYDNEEKVGIKNILKKVNELQKLDTLYINLALWMKQFYVLTYGKAFSIVCDFSKIYDIKYISNENSVKIPTYRVSKSVPEIYYEISKDYNDSLSLIAKNASRQLNLIDEIFSKMNQGDVVSHTQLKTLGGYAKDNLNQLVKKGILELREVSDNLEYEDRINNMTLNPNQKSIYERIISEESNKFLIRGVTGSGKTEIYFSLIAEAMERGKSSLLLVPEIGLTPQMVSRAGKRFGNNVALIHSKLTNKERIKELEKIESGEPILILGTRSAVFSKIENLAYIIIDEEHDDSYKLDSNNKYDAREVARYIIENSSESKMVLGSATPSMESYFKAKNGVYELLTIEDRANNQPLPNVKIVDMREELKHGNTTAFSMDLMAGMKTALNRNEQVLLFLNRRGYSPSVSCRDCGFTIMCESCDISMVYHKSSNSLKCHYCGKTKPFPKVCPVCGSKKIKQFGMGTEKLEEITKALFQDFEVLRIDSDTTSKKSSYESNFDKIINNEVSIIIGTQMITKGLDFPDITLVGVVAADMSLNIPEYDASEKTFQLLTQVAGRSGRSAKMGEVIIQTYNPEHYSLLFAKNHDYEGFYESELKLRKIFDYPPFKRFIKLNFLATDIDLLLETYRKSYSIIEDELKTLNLNDDIKITSNSTNPIVSKINNKYRASLLMVSGIRKEKQAKNLIYELVIQNKYKLNYSGISYDLLIR